MCPAGKYADAAGLTVCKDCPAGKYLHDDGNDWRLHTFELLCTLCPAGKSSNLTGVQACQDCDLGRFATNVGSSECTACQTGVAEWIGATACTSCYSGTGASADGKSCIGCARGTYSTSGTCLPCAAGRVAEFEWAYDCTDCTAGSYAANGTECVACEAGRFSVATASECSICPRGRSAAPSSSSCTKCTAGFYAAAGSESCLSCHGGFYSATEESYQCTSCRPGFYSTNGSDSCSACGAGQYPNQAQTECVDCPAGKKKADGDSFCVDCEQGKYAAAGSIQCTNCGAGTYSVTDRSSCADCADGTIATAGSSSCTQCDAGKVASWNKERCDDCWSGTYLPAGSNATQCITCEAGRYQNLNAQTQCTDCPIGKYYEWMGATSEFSCQSCASVSTLATGSTSSNDCIVPASGQFFDCIVGKPCLVDNFQGTLLTNSHSIMAKEEVCETTTTTTPYYGGGYGGYGSSASGPPSPPQSDAMISGFGTDGRSESGGSNYTWTGVVQASPGTYRLCWCGGLSEDCAASGNYRTDVGLVHISGPFSAHAFFCVKGQMCISQGPITGLGLTGQDLIFARGGCTFDWATGTGVTAGVEMTVHAANGSNGSEMDLYVGFNAVVQLPAYQYQLCWCSWRGESCSNMDLRPGSANTLYLEHSAGSLTIEGPGTAAEVECFLGQECSPTLPSTEGVNLAAADRLSALEQCGQGSLLQGLPGSGIAVTSEGYSFEFMQDANSSRYVESDPGFYRLCWCRPSNSHQCLQATDFNVAAGLFIATGPYPSQSHQCGMGSNCIVSDSDLRGVSLGRGDWLLPMAACGGNASRSFPLLAVTGTQNGSAYYFDLGHLELNSSSTPELLQLCWCSARSTCNQTSGSSDYRQLALQLYVGCPAGWYELGESRQCQECPTGHYCPGGWLAVLRACPAGSTAARGAGLLDECLCRRGFFWDASVSACLSCPAEYYKDVVGRAACDSECPAGTTSLVGAASIWECFCSGDAMDIDPRLEHFDCRPSTELSANSSENTAFASMAADVYLFTVTLQVADASTTVLLHEIQEQLRQLLEVTSTSRASLELVVRFTGSWLVDVVVRSSDPELAGQFRDKLDQRPFELWISSNALGTPLAGAVAWNRTMVETALVSCPSGLGLAPGYVTDLSDCKCPYGKQPAVAGSPGLTNGCVSCPFGSYKSVVADTVCVLCNQLTTLQIGALTWSACTCPAGLFEVGGNCEDCGLGFFCSGGTQRDACNASQATLDTRATSLEQCFCAPGYHNVSGACSQCQAGRSKSFVGNAECVDCAAGTFADVGQDTCKPCEPGRYSTIALGSCEACPAGRYSETGGDSLAACMPCAAGTWSNETGAQQSTACRPCVSGSTTEQAGAGNESFCVRPSPEHARQCISGRSCAVTGITGSSLRNGHRLAIASAGCSAAKLAVAGLVASGISRAATQNGSEYAWADGVGEFTPRGGVYNLCWCASMGTLTCDNLNSNFLLSAGQLLVAGPSANQLECLRGSDCSNLPFLGYELLVTDLVAVRRDGCGGSTTAEVSTGNTDGLGSLTVPQSLDI